jgi:dihydrofolate reductase
VSKLRVPNLVVSLDGFAAGEGQSLDAGFGHAQQAFMAWFEKIRLWRGLQPDGQLGPDEAIASAWGTAIGAEIMGRNKFRPTTGPWPEDGWRGWWGEDPPFHAPCFVMTHYEREPLTVGDTTFHFVNGTPAEVLAQAQKAAGDLEIRLGGGPTTVNEFLQADLVDYLHIVLVPIVLGPGVRLWTASAGCTSATPGKRSPCPAGPPPCSSPANPPGTRSLELAEPASRTSPVVLGHDRLWVMLEAGT